MHFYKGTTPCHEGPVEVIPNLYCGSMNESILMASPPVQVDVLVPLDSLDPEIWKTGFRGEIIYCPIEDYGILTEDILKGLILKLLDRLKERKKVGIFCYGGHGRTGYIAAILLGKLGYQDPIAYLRKHYCRQAVESTSQIYHIAEVLGQPELFSRYVQQNRLSFLYGAQYYGFEEKLFDTVPSGFHTVSVCGSCGKYRDGICLIYGVPLDEDEDACEEFTVRSSNKKKRRSGT